MSVDDAAGHAAIRERRVSHSRWHADRADVGDVTRIQNRSGGCALEIRARQRIEVSTTGGTKAPSPRRVPRA